VVFIDLSVHLAQRESGTGTDTRVAEGFHAMVDKEAVSSGGMIEQLLGDGAMYCLGYRGCIGRPFQGRLMRERAMRQHTTVARVLPQR